MDMCFFNFMQLGQMRVVVFFGTCKHVSVWWTECINIFHCGNFTWFWLIFSLCIKHFVLVVSTIRFKYLIHWPTSLTNFSHSQRIWPLAYFAHISFSFLFFFSFFVPHIIQVFLADLFDSRLLGPGRENCRKCVECVCLLLKHTYPHNDVQLNNVC